MKVCRGGVSWKPRAAGRQRNDFLTIRPVEPQVSLNRPQLIFHHHSSAVEDSGEGIETKKHHLKISGRAWWPQSFAAWLSRRPKSRT
jgi:hypothetical protein